SGEETGVGIAWRIGADRDGRKLIHHAGSMGGARSFVGFYPGQGVAVAVMTNTSWGSWIEQTAQMLAWPFLDPQPAGSRLDDGEFQASGKLRDQEVSGTLRIESGSARLVLREQQGEGAERHFRIRRLGESRYALVSWAGILDLTVTSGTSGLELRAFSTERKMGHLNPSKDPVLSLVARPIG
ncbi:MAG: serine hydrolase, partial [Acidobacteriota bacterium]